MHRRNALHRSLPDTAPGALDELEEIALAICGVRHQDRNRLANRSKIQLMNTYLRGIATLLLIELKEQYDAPTAKELDKELNMILSMTADASKKMQSLSEFSKKILNCVYRSELSKRNAVNSMQPERQVSAEQALEVIHAAVRNLVLGWRKGVLWPVTPTCPGRSRSRQRLLGDARAHTAWFVAKLVKDEQGLEAVSSDESGLVYRAVANLWCYATGLPEEGANLRKYIRQGTRAVIIDAELSSLARNYMKRQNDLLEKRDELLRSTYTDADIMSLGNKFGTLADWGEAEMNRIKMKSLRIMMGETYKRKESLSLRKVDVDG